jgi:RND superfamily putative drug exporter
MNLSSEALARSSARRPWTTIAIWVVALVTSVGLTSAFLGDALTTAADFTDNPESKQAQALIDEVRGDQATTELIVVTSESLSIAEPAFQAYVGDIQRRFASLSPTVVAHVGSYLTQDDPVSASGRSALIPVTLAGTDPDANSAHATALHDALAELTPPEGIEATIAGPATLENEVNRIAEEDLAAGETIGLAVALLVLVFVFGAVFAGLVPILVGILSIAIALGGASLVGLAFDLSFFVTNMITMIGLAVGIDYSLFVVSRYREERASGFNKMDAIGRAGNTASRAVFFSGMTVVLALLGMLLLPNTIFRSLGIGAILVVIAAVTASLTLLPAVLSLLGDRINWLRVRGRSARSKDKQGRFWDRVTNMVMRRPLVSLIASAGLLVALSLSYFSINTGFNGVSTLPDDIESKQAFAVLEAEFSGGLTSPVEIAVAGQATAGIAELRAVLAADPAFAPQSTVESGAAGSITIISAPLAGDVNSDASIEAVRELRTITIPAIFDGAGVTVLVGGETAGTVDFLTQTAKWTPLVFLFVLGLSFILLTVAFRSIVIPAKAIAMNLLSVGAAYGLIAMFFQIGVGPAWVKDLAGRLGFAQVEVIEAWLPLFLFSVLFGLSMDYHVFLLSRIKERFDMTGNNADSVAYGLRSTAAIITGAAAIMVAVFAGFAAGRLVSFQQMGFGLAAAVLLDATIVRSVLVPASMKLLGARNWYLPRWLEWLPEITVEGNTTEPEVIVELEERELVLV